jgi:hypothetical protein
MKNTTTRRSLLKAAPATVLIAAIPAVGSAATPAENVDWKKAKAAFRAADERMEAAGLAHNAMEDEQGAYSKTAPERYLTYTEEGFLIAEDGVRVEAQPREARFVLTRLNIHHATNAMKNTPEFAAFAAELATWRAQYDARAQERGWDASIDARCEALRALVACPVGSAQHVAEKLEIARLGYVSDEEAELLLDGVSADLARLTGRA